MPRTFPFFALLFVLLSPLFSPVSSREEEKQGPIAKGEKAPEPNMTITAARLEFKGNIRIFEGGVRLKTENYTISSNQGIFYGDENKVVARYSVQVEHKRFLAKGQKLEAWVHEDRAQLTGKPHPTVVEKITIPSDESEISQTSLRATTIDLLEKGDLLRAEKEVILERRIIGKAEKPLILNCEQLDYFVAQQRAVASGSLVVEGPNMEAVGDYGTFEEEDGINIIRITGEKCWLERVDDKGNKRRVYGRELLYNVDEEELMVIKPYSEVDL